MIVYKLLRAAEWASFDANRSFAGSVADLRDGFIHMSTGEQLAGTYSKHFADDGAIMLVTIDSNRLGPALRWEASRDGALFPHLYRPLDRTDVLAVKPFQPDALA